MANILYHGTSLTQFLSMRSRGFVVRDLYVGDSRENVTDHYARKQAMLDESLPVTIEFDGDKLACAQDIHRFTDGSEQVQEGQWTVDGDLSGAVLRATAVTQDGDELELPLTSAARLPDEVLVGMNAPKP